jgi:hypothetical protein
MNVEQFVQMLLLNDDRIYLLYRISSFYIYNEAIRVLKNRISNSTNNVMLEVSVREYE